MESSTKKYGLIAPKKKLDGVMKIANVFGDDSDSDNEAKSKPVQTNNRTKAQQRSAKLVIDKALEEDATVFQYDEVYDDMEKKKENVLEKEKKTDKKPKYIHNLLAQAEKRKIEYERRNERLIQKEREQEGDEFKDKEAFVTSSYKKKLEELKKLDEEDMKFNLIEDINDVTKQRNMNSFYRHLYKAELCKNENEESDEVKQTKKSDANRQYRKRASSNSSDDEANDDKDTDISDSDSSVDSPKRLKTENDDDDDDDDDIKKSEDEISVSPKEKSKVKTSIVVKSEENTRTAEGEEKKSSNDVPELKQNPKEKKIEKNKSEPKEIKPKINIWEKRTVGDIYEAARQRYFERKMKQINVRAQS